MPPLRTAHPPRRALCLLLALTLVALPGREPHVRAQSLPAVIIEPEDGRGPILDLIAAARISIDVAIYQLTDRRIVDALTAAVARGVQVRVLAEPLPGSKPQNARSLERLRKAGAQTRDSSPAFRLTHEKAIVVDAATALIMTLNLESGSFSSSREAALLDSDPADVAEIERVFVADWEQRPFAPAQTALVWSPDNARARLTALIASASDEIDVDAEELTDPGMIAALADAAQRGLSVRLLMSDRGAHDSSRPGRSALQAAGAQVRLLREPYVHAKLILVDGVLAFAGSQNLSVASLERNRELGLLTVDPTQVAPLLDVFERDWQRATPLA